MPEFFRYHGPMAIGVRLFRRLDFKAKAGIICAVRDHGERGSKEHAVCDRSDHDQRRVEERTPAGRETE